MIEIRLWDWIVFDGRRAQVVAVEGSSIELEDATTLAHQKVAVGDLISRATTNRDWAALKDLAEFGRLPAAEQQRCEKLAAVLAEAERAKRGPGTTADRAREKLAEIGVALSNRQVERYLAAFHAHGVAGLVDRRRFAGPRSSSIDLRIIELLESELAGMRDRSTGTRSRAIRRVQWRAAGL